jgi:hypothetical protein
MQRFKPSYALWTVLTLLLFLLACLTPGLVTEEGNVVTGVRELFGYHFYWQAVLLVLSVGVAAVVIG